MAESVLQKRLLGAGQTGTSAPMGVTALRTRNMRGIEAFDFEYFGGNIYVSWFETKADYEDIRDNGWGTTPYKEVRFSFGATSSPGEWTQSFGDPSIPPTPYLPAVPYYRPTPIMGSEGAEMTYDKVRLIKGDHEIIYFVAMTEHTGPIPQVGPPEEPPVDPGEPEGSGLGGGGAIGGPGQTAGPVVGGP